MRFASLAFLLALTLPAPVLAQCPSTAVGCVDDGVMFMWSDSLFDTIDLDTGWVPAGSPLQIRLGFHLAGETQIDMMGTTYSFWQPALSILPLGIAGGGRISVDYGLEIIARVRFDVTILGIDYEWEGDIPIPGGIPRDLRVADETFFDPFVLPGAPVRPIPLADTTDTINVVNLSLDSLIGSVAGAAVDGGFTLGVHGALDASYQGERIDVIRREVPGDPAVAIDEHETSAIVPAPVATGYGAFEDIAIDPVGTVVYEGSIVAEPTFYVEILGRRFDFTIATIDIPIVDTDSSPDFVPAEIHVPLPDVVLVDDAIDFGMVDVGERVEDTVRFRNDGEAELWLTARAPEAPFDTAIDPFVLPPGSERMVAVGFTPVRAGGANLLLAFDTNDPDRPIVTVRLNGEGLAVVVPDAGVADAGAPMGTPGISGGACGCSAAGTGRGAPVGLVLLLAGLLMRRRR